MESGQIERCFRLIQVHRGTACVACGSRSTWPDLTGGAGRLFLCMMCDECGHVASTPWAPPPA